MGERHQVGRAKCGPIGIGTRQPSLGTRNQRQVRIRGRQEQQRRRRLTKVYGSIWIVLRRAGGQ
jgi:hypothetical protein